MKSMIENNEFVENAEFSGNMYGTSKKSIQDVLDNGIQASFFCYFYCQYRYYVFMKPPSKSDYHVFFVYIQERYVY